ncbi:MAG: vitamin B12-dependent ribonucleotide reductase [Acidobacteriia bacterium]|nr:vitamin B12-dependent ribonucleotide reductase [Terriglobia bacterium]MYC65715.1 vitamin B12-dependent ribonucleotide reductase [Terriglobia bacterium]
MGTVGIETVVAPKAGVAAATGAEAAKDAAQIRRGLAFERYFTSDLKNGQTPYDVLEWEQRSAVIADVKGNIVFEQTDVEMPSDWSQTATNIVASKYFHGTVGRPDRESSLRQLVHRVVDTIADWGGLGGYFASEADVEAFRDDLAHLMLTQKASFNSPVWFNVGVRKESRGYGWAWEESSERVTALDPDQHRPQCSACFINSVQDSLESILDLAKTEGMLFKWGSGTGTNLSNIREDDAGLAGGGRASGPVSFMKGFDAFAGVIKSGGKTRRAAKMVILDVDHPDVKDFIWCKAREEKKAHVLIQNGYDSAIDGDAYSTISFQNANNSVRVTDEFMHAADEGRDWWTRSVLSKQPKERHSAKDLLSDIAEATHQCGDPGMQFDTTINRWNPVKNTDRIHASNPCSEYMFLNDSACNLASLNLKKFQSASGTFEVESFRRAVGTVILAQEILVDNAAYPTERIAFNSHAYRPLGLGFANLGAMLMSMGVPYDSDRGRAIAGAVSATMCGQAYLTSAQIAEVRGPFKGFTDNREPFLEVIRMHRDASKEIADQGVQPDLRAAAEAAWQEAYSVGQQHGYRNGQVTVIAPTGTIGFMMDCDTTGVEPELALVKYKKLVGGGVIKIVNNTVSEALERIGYSEQQVAEIVDHIDATETIEGASELSEDHLPVFDCSFKPLNGERSIHFGGHLKMMAAVQPFISGAISKTINMPQESSVDDIANAYMDAWRLGLKAVAIYRDGSKGAQPLSTGQSDEGEADATPDTTPRPLRRRLPDERESLTHKFSVGGHEGYLTVGLYPDTKQPGEIFIRMAKEGSTISGLMDNFATAISLTLQYGVPLHTLVEKFGHVRFEPSGWTNNKDIHYAKSITDYIFRWLGARYASHNEEAVGQIDQALPAAAASAAAPASVAEEEGVQALDSPVDGPPCTECGSIMTVNGNCYRCPNCGSTSGCS